MSNWPIAVPGGRHSDLSAAVTSTSGGTAFTYGAWSELVAACPGGVVGINLLRTSGPQTEQNAIRLAIGSAGNEVVIATLATVVTSNSAHLADHLRLPITVPAGARLSISVAAPSSSRNHRWRVGFVIGGGLYPLAGSRIELYGHTLSTLLGTTVTSGAGGAWGTGVEVVSATPRRARGLAITAFGAHNSQTLRGLVAAFIGTSDVIAGPVFGAGTNTTNNVVQALSTPQFAPCDIPAGTNLRLRALNDDGITTADRAYQLHLVY